MRKILASLAVTALVLAPAQAEAQDEGDLAAAVALAFTPRAGLASVVTPSMIGAEQTGLGYSFRYGRLTGDDAPNAFGASASYGLGAGAIGATIGYLSPSVDGVDGWMMIDVNYARHLLNAAVGASTAMNVGVDVGLGYGMPEDQSLLAISADVPVSLVAGSGNWRFVPFLKPGFGYGSWDIDGVGSESGTRFMLGAGIGILDGTRGLGFNLGLQKIFIENSETLIGLGFSWNPRR